MAEWELYFRMLGEVGVDSGDGLTFNFMGYSGQGSPTPEVFVDDVIQIGGYTVNNGSVNTHVSVTFNASQLGSVIRMSYRWKLELGAETECSVYELERTINVKDGVDANGRVFITESYEKAQPFRGLIGWRLIALSFWQMITTACSKPGTRIDVVRASIDAATSISTLNNLYIVDSPKYSEQANITGYVDAAIKVIGFS